MYKEFFDNYGKAMFRYANISTGVQGSVELNLVYQAFNERRNAEQAEKYKPFAWVMHQSPEETNEYCVDQKTDRVSDKFDREQMLGYIGRLEEKERDLEATISKMTHECTTTNSGICVTKLYDEIEAQAKEIVRLQHDVEENLQGSRSYYQKNCGLEAELKNKDLEIGVLKKEIKAQIIIMDQGSKQVDELQIEIRRLRTSGDKPLDIELNG